MKLNKTSYFFSLRLYPFADYDDYLDDDDLDLIEENLGVKVKRRVSLCLFCVSQQLKLIVLKMFLSCFTEEEI